MKCVVGTVCKVHRAVKARGVSECMLCMRLRKVCDTGWMLPPCATMCASAQHQEERGKICGNSSSSSIVDRLRQASLVCEVDLHSNGIVHS